MVVSHYSPVSTAVVEWDLGAGESEVIAVALQDHSAVAVIDDLAGRRCARAMGLRIRGTLGVVVTAARLGVIRDPRSVLEELRAAGMWLSDSVLRNALRVAGFES